MICEKCGERQATYHSSISVNGVSRETHLCERCASELNGNDLSLQNFFSDFLDDDIDLSQVICPNCRSSFEDFRTTGVLGCSNCYDIFRDQLLDIISDMQGSTKHKGKTIEFEYDNDENSAGETVVQTTDEKIEELREKLNEAVEREDYELASKIKKQIEELKEKR